MTYYFFLCSFILPHFSVRGNSQRKEFVLQKIDLFWKGFVARGSKQDVKKVAGNKTFFEGASIHIINVNPILTSGLVHPLDFFHHLDESFSSFRGYC